MKKKVIKNMSDATNKSDISLKFSSSETLKKYTYEITASSTEDDYKYSGPVVITFRNGNFESCAFPFKGTYTREHWAALGLIQKEIESLIRRRSF